VSETRRQFADAGVEVVCVDTSVRLGWLAGARREQQLDQARRMLDLAHDLGAPYLRVFGGELDDPLAAPDPLPAYREALAAVVALGEPRGVRVLLETHDSFSTARSVAELLAGPGAERRAGVLWDTLHSLRHGETFADSLAAVRPHLALVHIKDSAHFDADGFDLKLVGEGVVPVVDAIRLLRAANYDGYLCFEWEKGWHPEIEEPEIALPHSAMAIRSLLADVG
jgi:sugar phosphate isomerase/epimerase